MDGIFGVGLPEMVIIALALFIVGGPKNTAKWARELGVWVRKAREAWTQVIAEGENELGPEGKEVMDVARELGKGVNEVRNMNPTRRAMGETMRMVSDAVSLDEKPSSSATRMAGSTSDAPAPNGGSSGNNGSPKAPDNRYSAWVPPDRQD